jgi:hypothetical protein
MHCQEEARLCLLWQLSALQSWRQRLLELICLLTVLHGQRIQVLQGIGGKDTRLTACAAGCSVAQGGPTLLQRILNFVTLFAFMILTLRASFLLAVCKKSRISLICLGLQKRGKGMRMTRGWAAHLYIQTQDSRTFWFVTAAFRSPERARQKAFVAQDRKEAKSNQPTNGYPDYLGSKQGLFLPFHVWPLQQRQVRHCVLSQALLLTFFATNSSTTWLVSCMYNIVMRTERHHPCLPFYSFAT